MIKAGDKFRLVFVVTRLAEIGEKVKCEDGSEIELARADNKFWAKIEGTTKEILCLTNCGPIDWIK